MKNRKLIIISIFFIFFTFFISFTKFLPNNLVIYEKNNTYSQNEDFFILNNADPLDFADIETNTSTIYRLFESINFTIDTSDFSNANDTIMQISFSNGSIRNYSMAFVGNNEFYFEYKPQYNAPLGFQNVSFLIFDEIGTLLNDHTTHTNFTILSNYLLSLNSSEYHIGDYLYAELIVNNFKTYDFRWNITIVDSTSEIAQSNLLNLENNLIQFTIEIDNNTFSQLDKTYYIKLNMSDNNTGKKAAAYFPFIVRNSNPIITSNIVFSPDEIYRTDQCTISLNATDLETVPKDLSITMYIQDAEGKDVLEELLRHDSANSFSETFSIPANRPAGKYRINITAMDENGGQSSKVTFLTVKNNLPEIHSYKINGMSMDQSISIRYGENIIFTFNVSDVEGVAYVRVALLNENNEWFNITRTYRGEDTEISIRTIELITGVWFAYIYVIDSDGVTVSLTDDYDKAPQGIRIIPDILGNYLPWIVFFFGLSLGIIFGIGLIYRYFKSKFTEPERVSPDKKKTVTREQTTKKAITKISKEEFEKNEIEELKHKKEEEKGGVPKRKIKRKL